MATIEELLQLAAEGDEDAQEQIKRLFNEKDQKVANAERDLKLKTDDKLRERYPRAIRAWEKGRLKLGDDLNETDLLDILKDKEDEYAELGVPVETKTETEVVPAPTDGDGVVITDNDPAKALSGGKGPSSPGGSPRDYVAEFFDGMKGSTTHDQARAFALLPELNKTPEGKAKIAQITKMLEARPITPKLI